MENLSGNSDGGGDDDDIEEHHSRIRHHFYEESVEAVIEQNPAVHSEAVRSDDECLVPSSDADPDMSAAADIPDDDKTMPCIDSNFEDSHSGAPSVPEHHSSPSFVLPSRVSPFPTFSFTSIFCPSASSTSFYHEQFGIRMSSRATRLTNNVQPPHCFLDSFHSRFSSPNYVFGGLQRSISRSTQESALGSPSGVNLMRFCGSLSQVFSQNEITEDEEKNMSAEPPQAVGGSDPGPVSLQESCSGETVLATGVFSVFLSNFPSNLPTEISGPVSDVVRRDNELPTSVENSDYDGNVNSAGLDSVQCIATSQPNHSATDTRKLFSEDNFDWIMCKICFVNKWKYVFNPCGHASCASCKRNMSVTRRNVAFICPFCRSYVEEFIMVKLSYNLVHDPGE